MLAVVITYPKTLILSQYGINVLIEQFIDETVQPHRAFRSRSTLLTLTFESVTCFVKIIIYPLNIDFIGWITYDTRIIGISFLRKRILFSLFLPFLPMLIDLLLW